MKKNWLLGCLLLLAALPAWAGGGDKDGFSVLQWNIWQEGTMVEDGYEAIADEIARLKPDFVTFSEVRNYHGTRFCDRIVRSLAERGETYYSFYSYDSGLLSRYPITDSLTVFPENGDHGSIYKMECDVHGRTVAVYTAHLDYLNDAYYNVRGYDGSTWEEIPVPQTVLEVDIVILGGDFNEPSHLDWIRETKDLYDHNGLIIPWTVPLMLDNAGFADAYRERHPDVLACPGFTFPADNPRVPVNKLTWTPKSDERERIDYVFYHPHPAIELVDAVIFGPRGSICKSRRVEEQTQDPFLLPQGVWPTDHKGVLVTFRFR